MEILQLDKNPKCNHEYIDQATGNCPCGYKYNNPPVVWIKNEITGKLVIRSLKDVVKTYAVLSGDYKKDTTNHCFHPLINMKTGVCLCGFKHPRPPLMWVRRRAGDVEGELVLLSRQDVKDASGGKVWWGVRSVSSRTLASHLYPTRPNSRQKTFNRKRK